MNPDFGTLDVGMLGLKVLALAGGFGIGAICSGFLLRFMVKLAPVRKVRRVPGMLYRFVQLLGGTGAGLAVWLWAFGSGGGGFGQSGGFGLGGQGSAVSNQAPDD